MPISCPRLVDCVAVALGGGACTLMVRIAVTAAETIAQGYEAGAVSPLRSQVDEHVRANVEP